MRDDSEAVLRKSLVERTLALVRIPSVIQHEQAIADAVEAWGRGIFPPDRVARVSNTLLFGAPAIDARPTIGLFGHLDTVPPHPGDPEPHVTADELVGLGASDMKSGLAVMQLLAETLDLQAIPFNLVFVFYEREEGPYLENGLGPLFAAHPELARLDFAICLEPSDNVVQMGCCGALHATIAFQGKGAHSARPWQGENAIHKAGPLLAKLQARAPVDVELDGFRFREVMSATLASGGRARNVVPDAFTLNLNYRFAPNRTLDAAQDEVRALVGSDAAVTFTDLSPAGPVFAHHPILQRLRDRTGVAIESKQAWTDVARLATYGIPAVNFGPGESAQAHQAREKVSLPLLVASYRHFERFLT